MYSIPSARTRFVIAVLFLKASVPMARTANVWSLLVTEEGTITSFAVTELISVRYSDSSAFCDTL